MSKAELMSQYNETGSQISDVNSQNQELEEAIRVLDSSHKKLKEIKEDVKNIKSSIKTKSKEYGSDSWVGTRYDNDFKKIVNDRIVNSSVKNLINDIDETMAEINTKRASLQKEMDDNGNLLGKLKGWLNQLAAEIENWVD